MMFLESSYLLINNGNEQEFWVCKWFKIWELYSNLILHLYSDMKVSNNIYLHSY